MATGDSHSVQVKSVWSENSKRIISDSQEKQHYQTTRQLKNQITAILEISTALKKCLNDLLDQRLTLTEVPNHRSLGARMFDASV